MLPSEREDRPGFLLGQKSPEPAPHLCVGPHSPRAGAEERTFAQGTASRLGELRSVWALSPPSLKSQLLPLADLGKIRSRG